MGVNAARLAVGCAIVATLMSVSAARAQAPEGPSSEGIDLAFETGPLAVFVERLRALLGAPLVYEPALAGTVTVRSRGRAGREQALQLSAALLELHGLQLERRSDGALELLSPERLRERHWAELRAQATGLRLRVQLDRLTDGMEFPLPYAGESLAVVGPRGFVVLRRFAGLDAEAIPALLELLAAPPFDPDHPEPEAPASSGSGSRVSRIARETLAADIHHVDVVTVLGVASRFRNSGMLTDPDALQPMLVDYHASGPAADLESLARALLALQGYEFADGAGAFRYPRLRLREPGVERMPQALAARLATLPRRPPELLQRLRDSRDLSAVLAALGRSWGERLLLDASCPRLLDFARTDVLVSDLASIVGALLESHDLVAREGRDGEIEVAPRSACPGVRTAVSERLPHPALARLGVRAGDWIVAIDGVRVEAIGASKLRERLRGAGTASLEVRSALGEPMTFSISADALLALLGG